MTSQIKNNEELSQKEKEILKKAIKMHNKYRKAVTTELENIIFSLQKLQAVRGWLVEQSILYPKLKKFLEPLIKNISHALDTQSRILTYYEFEYNKRK